MPSVDSKLFSLPSIMSDDAEEIREDDDGDDLFTMDIAGSLENILTSQRKEQSAMLDIIRWDKHQPSHAWYYKCYERMSIHRLMVNDRIRTGTYLMAMSRNKHMLKDKTVLDVGCGTGILSVFAAKFGEAKLVIDLDASRITTATEALIRHNHLDDRITVIRGKIEDIAELPLNVREVDVIVSEWMGYGLFNETVLDTVITARQRFLKDGGFILPDVAKLRILGSSFARDLSIGDKVAVAEQIFSSVDLSFLTAAEDCFTINTLVAPNQILTDDSVLKVVDMYTVKHDDVRVIDSNFHLVCDSHGIFRSFVLFFDVLFNLPNSWAFSTSPEAEPTHWRQTVCCLGPGEEFEVWEGTLIKGKIRMLRIDQLPRFWTIEIDYTVSWKKQPPVQRTRTFFMI